MIFHNRYLTFPFDNDSAPFDESMLYNSFAIQKPVCDCQQIPPHWMPQYSYGSNTLYGYLIWRILISAENGGAVVPPAHTASVWSGRCPLPYGH